MFQTMALAGGKRASHPLWANNHLYLTLWWPLALNLIISYHRMINSLSRLELTRYSFCRCCYRYNCVHELSTGNLLLACIAGVVVPVSFCDFLVACRCSAPHNNLRSNFTSPCCRLPLVPVTLVATSRICPQSTESP